jgi:phytoene dehydrogenase-like protein
MAKAIMAKAIIIGSGMSGLTAAAFLARAGHQVTVLEQFPTIGGVTATLHKDGFSWDLGPLNLEGFGPGEPAGEVLQELGLQDQVRLVRAARGVAFPDYELWKPAEYSGPYWRRERLKEIFPEEADGLDRYYQFYDRMLDLAALARRAEKAHGVAALPLKAQMLLAFSRVSAMKDWNAQQVLDSFFKRPELQALYTGILADFVVRPTQFQGLGIPFVNVETAYDERMPLQVSKAGPRPSYHSVIGGVGQLVAAMASSVQKNGGQIHLRAPARQIIIEEGRARGVVLEDGTRLEADLVVASGGARETLFELVGRQHLTADFTRRIEDIPLMESVLMVHLGIDIDPLPYQPGPLCYYYGTYDVEGGVERCQRGEYHEGRDGFLIYVPSLHSSQMAPPGCQAVTIYTIAPNRLDHGNWEERKEELADKLLAEAEKIIPKLRQHTIVRVVMTPEDFKARTHLLHHAFGGCAPVMGKDGAPHRTPIQGLWFIGAQSESKGGVTNVVVGARKAARMILESR